MSKNTKDDKIGMVTSSFGRPNQHNIGSVMLSEQSSDADMYMSGLSRPTNNNDKQTAGFNSIAPSQNQ